MTPDQARETFKNGNPWPITLEEAQRLAQIERSQRNESPETKKANALLFAKFKRGIPSMKRLRFRPEDT
jgi:hypothetical protein